MTCDFMLSVFVCKQPSCWNGSGILCGLQQESKCVCLCVHMHLCNSDLQEASCQLVLAGSSSVMKPQMEGASPVRAEQSLLVGVWCFGNGTGPQHCLVSELCPRVG